MKLLSCLILWLLLKAVSCQSNSDLTIRILDPDSKETLDNKVSSSLSHVLFQSICKSAGNTVTVRLNPVEGTTDIMDEQQALTSDTKGVTSCVFEDSVDHVTCSKSEHFCEQNNKCTVEIKSSCFSDMITMHYVDVTLFSQDGQLILHDCQVLCERVAFHGDNYQGDTQGLSTLAIGLIVAGIILFASMLVIVAVILKVRDSRKIREHHHKVHYVK